MPTPSGRACARHRPWQQHRRLVHLAMPSSCAAKPSRAAGESGTDEALHSAPRQLARPGRPSRPYEQAPARARKRTCTPLPTQRVARNEACARPASDCFARSGARNPSHAAAVGSRPGWPRTPTAGAGVPRHGGALGRAANQGLRTAASNPGTGIPRLPTPRGARLSRSPASLAVAAPAPAALTRSSAAGASCCPSTTQACPAARPTAFWRRRGPHSDCSER